MSNNKFSKAICFPCGGGGNHLVNLLLIDKQFNPFFEEFGLENPNVKQKMDFIKNQIYPDTRTWCNWLETEWQYRNSIEKFIGLFHEYYDWETITETSRIDNIPENAKILFLRFENLQLLIDRYWYINLGLNNRTPDRTKKIITEWQNELAILEKRNFDQCLILPGEPLHQDILDRIFYTKICNWFGLEDLYPEASEIHGWWVYLRKKSAGEFVDWFNGKEFQNYLEKMKNLYLTMSDNHF